MKLKIFSTAMLICAVIFLSSAKSFAAEFELVSYSAQVKLQWLANTGMPEAKKILNEIGTANIYNKKNLKDYARLEKLNGIYQELCYASTAQYVQTNDYKNIMDIGGGYTPRALLPLLSAQHTSCPNLSTQNIKIIFPMKMSPLKIEI